MRARATSAKQWTALLFVRCVIHPHTLAASWKNSNKNGAAAGEGMGSKRFELVCSVPETGAVTCLAPHSTSVILTSAPSHRLHPTFRSSHPIHSAPSTPLFLLHRPSPPPPGHGRILHPKTYKPRDAPLAGTIPWRAQVVALVPFSTSAMMAWQGSSWMHDWPSSGRLQISHKETQACAYVARRAAHAPLHAPLQLKGAKKTREKFIGLGVGIDKAGNG